MAGVISSLGNLVTGGAKAAANSAASMMPTRQSNALPNTFLTSTGQLVRQGAVNNAQAQAVMQTQPQQGNSMGGLSFGDNAFPGATQAAFGGMGGLGYGVGYGGSSEGASIIIPADAFYQSAAAPSGGAEDYTTLVIIAGMVLAVVLVIGMIGNKKYSRR